MSAARKKAPPAAPQPALASDPAGTVRRLNRWRDSLNPLRGLTIAQAITRLDQVQRGITADAQWTYQLIERRDEDLIAVIESTSAALMQLNWYIRTCEGDKRRAAQWDDVLAAEQSAVLLEYYNRIDNLYAAIGHLASATFRGYAHVQIRAEGDWLTTLEIVDQWNVCRDGHHGDWYWNPEARNVDHSTLPPGNRLDPSAYMIVETPRPVDEVALIKHLRFGMSAKDWDAFIEIYGIPSWIITMPSGIPPGKEAEYSAAAAEVAAGGSGALPNGCTATAAGYPAGEAPFEKHMKYWSERIVLAATGGLLTSVALPTGIGSGASDEHAATFERIARGRARIMSEQFQRKIDAAILRAAFPGRPHLAYWDLDAREETDTGAIVTQVAALAAAGYMVDAAQVAERTGYKVTLAPKPAQTTAPFMARGGTPLQNDRTPLQNRASAERAPRDASGRKAAEGQPEASTGQAILADLARSLQDDLRPIADRISALLDLPDAERAAAAEALAAELPSLIPDDPQLAAVVERAVAEAFVATATQEPGTKNQEPGTKNQEPA